MNCCDCIFCFIKDDGAYCDWYDIKLRNIETVCEYFREVQ